MRFRLSVALGEFVVGMVVCVSVDEVTADVAVDRL
jgi:hypothetical protein